MPTSSAASKSAFSSQSLVLQKKKSVPPARPDRPPSVRSSPVPSRKNPPQSASGDRPTANHSRTGSGSERLHKEPVKPPKPALPSQVRTNGVESVVAKPNRIAIPNGAAQGAQNKPKPFKPPPPSKPAALNNNNATTEKSSDDSPQLSVSELRKRLAANMKS